MRILVGVPVFDSEDIRYAETVGMAIQSKVHQVDVMRVVGTNTPNARNIIAKKALEDNFDHVLYLDCDMVHPPYSLDTLVSYNLDIVGGYYHAVRNGYHIQVFKKEGLEYVDFLKKSAGVVEVESIGTGCLLVRVDVFRHIKFPYFNYEVIGDNEFLVSEDIIFCRKASKVGYKIHCDAGLRCGHVGKFVVWPDDDTPKVRFESGRTS
jgi:GT2 family glycosyltransferase